MDEQRVTGIAKDATEAGKTATGGVAQVVDTVKGKLPSVDTANAMLDQGKAAAQDTLDKATTLARQVSESGGQAASRAGDTISRYTAEQPLTALLIAGLIGYGFAYLIHR